VTCLCNRNENEEGKCVIKLLAKNNPSSRLSKIKQKGKEGRERKREIKRERE